MQFKYDQANMAQKESTLRAWLEMSSDSPFSLANIPFGIFSSPTNPRPRIGTAIGDFVFDIASFFSPGNLYEGNVGHNITSKEEAFLDKDLRSILATSQTLNLLALKGRPTAGSLRNYIQNLFIKDGTSAVLHDASSEVKKDLLIPINQVTMHMPFDIGDYTDFYAGLHHAANCGRLFRGPGQELQPNYKHIPVGYHGRASSVVVSGTPITRPSGQILPPASSSEGPPNPIFSACRKLDFELELGCFVGTPNPMGQPIPLSEAPEHLFGVVLLNDWSARDIQSWEMVPLGPFNAKNFATTISPWVITFDALEPFLVPCLENSRPLLPYLTPHKGEDSVVDVSLQVSIKPHGSKAEVVTNTNGKNLLFSFAQMLAHHSIGGCPFNPGDLLGSGTISGTEKGQFGSLLEQTSGGKNPVHIAGEERTFLQDGDEVIFTGKCGNKPFEMVGFGECRGIIMKTNCPLEFLSDQN